MCFGPCGAWMAKRNGWRGDHLEVDLIAMDILYMDYPTDMMDMMDMMDMFSYGMGWVLMWRIWWFISNDGEYPSGIPSSYMDII
jgi:hypothetical protein